MPVSKCIGFDLYLFLFKYLANVPFISPCGLLNNEEKDLRCEGILSIHLQLMAMRLL